MPSLEDLGTRQIVSGTPASDDIVAFFDVSEFGNNPVKKTTVASLLAGAAGSTDSLTTSDGTAAAAAGDLGEVVEQYTSSLAAVSLSTGVTADVTSITLTPGDWDVTAMCVFQEISASVTLRQTGISTVSGALPGGLLTLIGVYGVPSTTLSQSISVTPPLRPIRVTTTTTVYLVSNASFTAGIVTAYGRITARRVR